MQTPTSETLCARFGLSELWLGITKRSRAANPSIDRHSHRILIATIGLCVILGIVAKQSSPSTAIARSAAWNLATLVIFVSSLILRWWSIFWLGRYFTVNVEISSGHQLIETGPYRVVRHPSYTGLLLMLVGLGLMLGNWVSLFLLLIPTASALLYRIHVEEAALLQAFGDGYRSYCTRTNRLIPFVY